MERYDKYKDSGVEWIGEIPEGWEVKKLKYVADLRSGNNLVSEQIKPNGDYPVFGGNGLRGYFDDCTHEGEFVLIGRQGALCGNIHYVTGMFWATDHAVVAKPTDKYATTWFGELLKAMNLNQYSVAAAQPGLSVDAIKNLLIPFPDFSEQTTIANYLDRKTAEIDQLITQKEDLHCLYEEEKAAIINQAVTQGINPDVKLKDSGIDWLGEIPEHWEVKKLKYVVSDLISGPFGSSLKKEVYVNKGYKIYGQEQVIKNDMSYGNYYISEDKYNEMSRYKISKNDILISCVGTFGKILLVPDNFQKGIINPRLIKLSPVTNLIEPVFLNILLKSPASFCQFDLLSRGGTMGVINLDLLKQLLFSIPPINEQTAIVNHIETETTRINAKITKTKKIIALQKEYRTALISEVVTGKIKVTQEVAS